MPNKPHHGHGQYGSLRKGLMGGFAQGHAGAHMPLRKNTGYDDRHGYKEGPKISPKDQAKRPQGYPGKSQVPRLNAEVTSRKASERRDGYHTGKPSKGDTRRRAGAEGNGKGTADLKLGKVRTSDHKGTSGRGGAGALNQTHSNRLSESPSHDWFEKLGC